MVEALTCPTTAPGTECRSRKPWAVPLEQGIPVRRFTSRKGQRHLSGLWWSATTNGLHVSKKNIHEHYVVGLRPQARKNR